MPRRHRLPNATHSPHRRPRRDATRRVSNKRLLKPEQLEDRRLLAVSFELNFLGGNLVGFNDPILGAEYRSAMEAAAGRLGTEILHDATIELDVSSEPFNGTNIATATSGTGPATPGGGFVHRVVPSKIIGEGDLNGSAVDGSIEIFFFSGADSFTYITDPVESDAPGEIDFQAVIRHELVHMIGFTSNTRSDGSDDSGNGIITPGTWAPFDRFVSDLNGNRFINPDSGSPFVYRLDVTQWMAHSTGGSGPNAGLFFDGPIATAVYGGRVPLYSPAQFSLSSSVSHLDSENYPNGNYQFSPRTYLMSHATVTGGSPQDLTLIEKAILADTGVMLRENVPPVISTPRNIEIEANATNGFTGNNQAILDFLAEAIAEDVFDPNPTLLNDKPAMLAMGENIITFTATDLSGNLASTTANITVSDTTSPTFSLPGTLSIHANTPVGANLEHPDLIELILASASDIADDALTVTANVDFLPMGENSITFTVTDDSGNSTQSSTSLTITDNSLSITTLDDELDANPSSNPSDLSLREAIEIANQNTEYSVIQFASGLTGTVTLTPLLGSLQISESLGLYGLGFSQSLINAQGHSRAIDIVGTGIDVVIDGLTVSEGNVAGLNEGGAGIRFNSSGKLSISQSRIIDNSTSGSGGVGGGIQIVQGELLVLDSWINSNLTTGPAAGGGGVWSQSDVTIRSSTISGNSTEGSNSPGGGLRLQGSVLRLLNSTLSGNDVLEGDGAGIFGDETFLDINNSTIVNNSASGTGGGIALAASGSAALSIQNTVIANNTDNGTAPDFTGTGVLSLPNAVRYSLVGNNTGTTLNESQAADPTSGNLVGALSGAGIIDPQLLALSDYGGPTPTHLPEETSPLIDAGDPNFQATLFTPALQHDQRASPHVRVSNTIDIGAIETTPPLQISWPSPEDIAVGTALSATQLNATANIPGNFSYLPAAGTVLGLGQSQTLDATFTPDDLQLYSTTDTSVTINVTSSSPTLTWNPPSDIVFGTPLGAAQLNATANVAGTFTYAPAAGTVLDANPNQSLEVTFNPTSAGFVSVSGSVEIDVLKATPQILWNEPDPIVVGTPLTVSQLNATSNVSGTFSYTPTLGTILGLGNGQFLTTIFTPDATNNYHSDTVQRTIDVVELQDFGDAPANYPVTIADDGARHLIGTLKLGTTVDEENAGQPSADASGDGSDEDGVIQIADAIALPADATGSSFEITSSEAGKVDAWIDFNADGDWQDPGEKILDSLDVVAGDNVLSYVIPAGATPGQTAARFRISSAGGLEPTGAANDGEVEDYMVTLLNGTNQLDINLDLAGNDFSLFVTPTEFVAQTGAIELLRLKTSSIGSIALIGRNVDQMVSVNLGNNFAPPAGGISVQGGSGSNTLQLLGDETTLDLTHPLIQIERFQTLDLTGSEANTVIVDAVTVAEMSPSQNQLSVIFGNLDRLQFTDLAGWSIGDASILNGNFLQTAMSQVNNAVIVLDPVSPWRNFLRPGDVNADNNVTVLDALFVINELARNTYSDPATSDLHDPVSAGSFPGLYFDNDGNGKISALDALMILNELAANSSEGESKEISPSVSRHSSVPPAFKIHTPNVSRQHVLIPTEISQSKFPECPLQNEWFKRDQPSIDPVDQLLADDRFMDELLLP